MILRLFVFCFSLSAILAASPAGAASDRHVVVISIDGFPAYLLGDPKQPLPTIRRLASAGTAAEGMRVSNPSVTWPNHTSLVTGMRPEKHGVLFNGVLVRGAAGEPVALDPKRDKTDLVRVQTVYELLHDAGFSTAEINWPCTRNSPHLDDSFPDVPDNVQHSTPRLRSELVAAGILKDESDVSFRSQSIVGRDDVWTNAACHVIRERKPNLLLLHLLNVDATHHAEGPQSQPGYTAVAYADCCVARVLAALDEAGIRDRTTVFIVADHGFSIAKKALKPNVLLRKARLLTTSRPGKIDSARAQAFPEGGIAMVYLTDPASREEDRQRVGKLFADQEGIAEVLMPEQYAQHGLPQPREYEQMADLVLVGEDGYAFSGSADGEQFVVPQNEGGIALGNHGFIATNPKMNAVFVAAGAGIKPGVKLGLIDNIDVAPTVARLFGQSMPHADGRVLKEILQPQN